MTDPAIVWFRDDQRLTDNPALHAAAASGRPLLCVYVHDEESEGIRPLGGAAKWWLHQSIAALDRSLAGQGGRLLILRGRAGQAIEALAGEIQASAVYWNRRYDAPGIRLDARLKASLQARGIEARSFNGHLFYEPWTVATKSGGPFRVFTAYWRAARQRGDPATPLASPQAIPFAQLPTDIQSQLLSLDDLALEPRSPNWAGGLRETWGPGEAGARRTLETFLGSGLPGYAASRDRPDRSSTSRLSPYLRFGNISPRQVWHAAVAAHGPHGDLDKFLSELGWREFCYHLLYYQPDLATRNFQSRFEAMAWRDDPAGLEAWKRGLTGYPIVDAGMRELWTTGWMHNRVRMIVASFLAKDLLIDWRRGEEWFWDTLVDADPANNPASWQWVAGTGADAAPYFRIFNPVVQGEKFDPDGAYVRRWVPELAGLPNTVVHKPWLAKAARPRRDAYPEPVVDHGVARRRALAALAQIKAARTRENGAATESPEADRSGT